MHTPTHFFDDRFLTAAATTGWPEIWMMSPGMEPLNEILLRFLKTISFDTFKTSDLAPELGIVTLKSDVVKAYRT